MRLPHSGQICRTIFVAAPVVALLALALAGAQTRPTPPTPQPAQRPTPAARATPLGRTAPPPLQNVKMFHPGNFPPPHVMSLDTGGPIPEALTAMERQQIFPIGPNAPIASLTLSHMLEPNRAGLRVFAPEYVGDGRIYVWQAARAQQQTYVWLDLYADANKTYFMDMTFETDTADAHWGVWGPDSMAEMDFHEGAKKFQHLTFGFANTGKPDRILFTMAPRQESIIYRMDVYVK